MQDYFIAYSPDRSGFSHLGRPYPRQMWNSYFFEQREKKKEKKLRAKYELRPAGDEDDGDITKDEEEEEQPPPKPPIRQPRKPVPMETLFDTIYIGVETRLNIVYQEDTTTVGTARYLVLSFIFIWYWYVSRYLR